MKYLTPKIGIMVIVLFLILSAVLMVVNRDQHTSTTSSASGSPRSTSPTLASSVEKSGNIGEYYDGKTGASASASATPVPKPPALTTYIYPGSKTISSTAVKLQLETNTSPEQVTAWYKKKINDLKFNAKSFANTNTGGDILNKLSAAKPGEKIDITIKKDQTTSKVSITVDRP